MSEGPNGQQYAEIQPYRNIHPQPRPYEASHDVAVANGEDEGEPYTIKCICGFEDDDGSTVFCDECQTWQHIECYYYPSLDVPEVHQCVDCSPRTLDSAGANQRQKRRQNVNPVEDNKKGKRTAPRSHKKPKNKDATAAAAQVNGVAPHLDTVPHDRKSGSPRDPNAAKRPKTIHKRSGSVAANHTGRPPNSRIRSGSIYAASPVKGGLGEYPPNYFSREFIDVHKNNTDFVPAPTNLHLNIGVTNQLSRWLDDPEAFAEATGGKKHTDVFAHCPQPIEDLEIPIQKRVEVDENNVFWGGNPTWPYLLTDRDVHAGDIVGELRGSIGLRDEYFKNPANRWQTLRHPDHFVFFHPELPIYIDCRSEGTLLRYARRSCRPNLSWRTIITGERDYRFCFVAKRDIPRGAEITIGWDIRHDQQLKEGLTPANGSDQLSESQKAYVSDWVERVLAHFGGCACNNASGSMCLMDHFDHRLGLASFEQATRPKGTKRKKGNQSSPPNTGHAMNSRAGSETVPLAAKEEDNDDNRSSTRSTQSKTSRDATPTAAWSTDAAAMMSNLSERDKRKLMQQERLFNKLEQEEQQGARKKKRNSGSGSHQNTPSIHPPVSAAFTTDSTRMTLIPQQKQAEVSEPTASNPATPVDSSTSRSAVKPKLQHYRPSQAPNIPNNIGHAAVNRSLFASRNQQSSSQSPPRPVYADSSTQTDPANRPAPANSPVTLRRPYIPLSQRLLRRAQLRRSNIDASPQPVTSINPHISPPSPAVVAEPTAEAVTVDNHCEDIDMKDVTELPETLSEPIDTNSNAKAVDVPEPLPPQDDSMKPPAPPWTAGSTPANALETKEQPDEVLRPPHPGPIELPANPLQAGSSPDNTLVATPDTLVDSVPQVGPGTPSSATPSTVANQPARVALMGTAQPSPVKKMSLSDYLKQRASKTPANEKSQGQSLQGGASPPGPKQASAVSAVTQEGGHQASLKTEGSEGEEAKHGLKDMEHAE